MDLAFAQFYDEVISKALVTSRKKDLAFAPLSPTLASK